MNIDSKCVFKDRETGVLYIINSSLLTKAQKDNNSYMDYVYLINPFPKINSNDAEYEYEQVITSPQKFLNNTLYEELGDIDDDNVKKEINNYCKASKEKFLSMERGLYRLKYDIFDNEKYIMEINDKYIIMDSKCYIDVSFYNIFGRHFSNDVIPMLPSYFTDYIKIENNDIETIRKTV